MADTKEGEPAGLALGWTFGVNSDASVLDLKGSRVFYAAAQNGVVYDYESKSQTLLQGHCNPISCAVASTDKKLIVTGDKGEESLLAVWNAETGQPLHTLFSPHAAGIVAIDLISLGENTFWLAALSAQNESKQQLFLWECTYDEISLVAVAHVPTRENTTLRFNPSNPNELVSNSTKSVVFWLYDAQKNLTCYVPRLSRRRFKRQIKTLADFTKTCFLPGTSQAVTATSDGFLFLWDARSAEIDFFDDLEDEQELEGGNKQRKVDDKIAVKVVRVSQKAINFLSTAAGYLVVAGDEGKVRFYDYMFRIEAWFEELGVGAVTSVSFSESVGREGKKKANPDTTSFEIVPNPTSAFSVDPSAVASTLPDFVLCTRGGLLVKVQGASFANVEPSERRGTTIVEGLPPCTINGLVVHTSSPLLITAAQMSATKGALHVWNYLTKQMCTTILFDDEFQQHQQSSLQQKPKKRGVPTALAINSKVLAVGTSRGEIRLLNSNDETFTKICECAKPGKDAITLLKFNGDYLAAADAAHYLYLWKLTSTAAEEESSSRKEWIYQGRCQTHSSSITALDFGVHRGAQPQKTVLVSVAEDRNMVEIDVLASAPDTGLKVLGVNAVDEPGAIPTAMLWHPPIEGDFEDRIITANSMLKFKQWNADNKLCRSTTLGPSFGDGPVTHLLELPQSKIIAYATERRVLGLVALPLDGDPTKLMGLVAHSERISGLAASPCGKFLFSTGGTDATICLWNLNTENAFASVAADISPFLSLLKKPNEYDEIVDYFYYLQLRHQGEHTTEPRSRSGKIQLADVPSLMRALGHYLSETEIANLIAEVRYSQFSATGEVIDQVGLDDFIKLYVNHRAVHGLNLEEVQSALTTIQKSFGENPEADDTTFFWKTLCQALQARGDTLSSREIDLCLKALRGANLPPSRLLTQEDFIHDILGFKAVVPDDMATVPLEHGGYGGQIKATADHISPPLA